MHGRLSEVKRFCIYFDSARFPHSLYSIMCKSAVSGARRVHVLCVTLFPARQIDPGCRASVHRFSMLVWYVMYFRYEGGMHACPMIICPKSGRYGRPRSERGENGCGGIGLALAST